MANATETLDLTEVLAVLESWRRIASMTSINGPDAHRRMYRRSVQTKAAGAACRRRCSRSWRSGQAGSRSNPS
ncbi:MAG: hypothetical protein H0V41_11190 [Pseudonocardiales bacterium]|nr:hypothetical protein [Pseudonocardiales bacterium]